MVTQNLKIRLPDEFFASSTYQLIVDFSTKRLMAVELDLLVEFDRVCKKHNIEYFLDSGTLLGAARHNGFIPWDDDVDVIMFRTEYNRLCEIAGAEFEEPYFFQTNKTDPGSLRGHAQLRRSDTTAFLKSEMKDGRPLYGFNQGVFMDVFILDDIPDSDEEYLAFARKLEVLKSRPYDYRRQIECGSELLRGRLSFHNLRYGARGLIRMFKDWLFGQDCVALAFDEFEKFAQSYNNKGLKRCANITLIPMRNQRKRFPKELYKRGKTMRFEKFDFPVPDGYEDVLVRHYGDWHKHVIGGTMHGGLFIDLDKPYTEYLKK